MISVVVPVYKAEPYLRRCVDSILAQTHQDMEIILVDDGSPDNCGAICDEYAARDSRVKVIHQQNAGVSVARNAGMELARGEYMAFVDSDDYIDDTMYEQLLAVAEQTNADVVECNYRYGQWDNEDSGNVYIYTGPQALEKMFTGQRYGDGFCVSPDTKLIRRDVLGDIIFLPGCSIAEDALFVTELLCRAQKAVKLDRSFYNYYMSEDSAMRSDYSLRRSQELTANRIILEHVAKLDQPGLLRFLQSRYLSLIESHWRRCYARKTVDAFHSEAARLHKLFQKEYPAMRQSLSRAQKIKYALFRRMPAVYYKLYRAYADKKG